MEHGSALTNARTQPLKYSPSFELFVMIFCPLLNSVAGIVIDLYAPSMPAIGRELNASAAAMQNTIVIASSLGTPSASYFLECFLIGKEDA